MRSRAAVVASVLALAGTLPAAAVEPTLAPASVDAALQAGRAMADQRGGYTIAPYLLYSAPDAVLITDDTANVEAIELGTPFERLRFEAYREQITRIPFNAADVATFDDQHNGHLDFIVYAHSRAEGDRAFLDRFGGGTLVRADGSVAATAQRTHTIAVVDTYTKPGGVVVSRYLGQVTYRFALADPSAGDLQAPLTFAFTDDGGTEHRTPVTLSSFR